MLILRVILCQPYSNANLDVDILSASSDIYIFTTVASQLATPHPKDHLELGDTNTLKLGESAYLEHLAHVPL